MTGHRIPAPGDPSPRELAAADQKHALVRTAVTKLVADAVGGILRTGYDPEDLGVWIDVTMNDCLDAALSVTTDGDELASMLAGMLGEAVLRLARVEASARTV